MKIKYLISHEHHQSHLSFFKNILGGEEVYEKGRPHEIPLTDKIKSHDGKDVIWIFSHLFVRVHCGLKGRQVHVNHGISFKPWLDDERAAILNEYFDVIIGGAPMHEHTLLRYGIDPKKIRRISYPILFDIPKIPVEPDSILFSSTVYSHWNHYQNLYHILKRLHPSLKGYLTMHPNTRDAMRELLLSACQGKKNIKVLETQEELMEAYAYCAGVVGGSSSVCAPFWFLKKPVIFLKGGEGYNPIKRFGWGEIKKQVANPAFDQILKESTKISHWLQFNPALVKKAKIAPSAASLFYPHSGDRDFAVRQIRECVAELCQMPADRAKK